MERPTLGALTGARFVAALAVVVYHYTDIFRGPAFAFSAAHASLWRRIIHQGSLGVDFFFLLSGFILAYMYCVPGMGMRGSARAFWGARVARIYPVYLVGLALGAIPFLARAHQLTGLLAAAILQPLLLHAWVPLFVDTNAWNPPSWTLSNEACFYLLFPAVVVPLARSSARQLWLAAAGAYAVWLGLPVITTLAVWEHEMAISRWLSSILSYHPLMRLPEFVLGVALGLNFLRRSEHGARRGPLRNLPADLLTGALTLLALALMTVTVAPPLPQGTLVLPVLAALVTLLASGRGGIARLLSTACARWLGEISYGIYMLHWPLWSWVSSAGALLHLEPAAPVLAPAYGLVLLGAAAVSYRYIERPARRALRALWERPRWRQAAPDIAPATSATLATRCTARHTARRLRRSACYTAWQ